MGSSLGFLIGGYRSPDAAKRNAGSLGQKRNNTWISLTLHPRYSRIKFLEALMGKNSRLGKSPKTRRGKQIRQGERHPLFGALKDVTFIPPGVDPTEPADPDWGEVYEPRSPDRAKRNPGTA
jgi:hypothetical protein